MPKSLVRHADIAFLVSRVTVLIGLAGFKFHSLVANGTGWKCFRPWHRANRSGT